METTATESAMTVPENDPGRSLVVLLDDGGRAVGVMPKANVHHGDTPLHLAFSCYVVDDRGRLLVTRRALDKATFPGVVTNSVCGHPGPGEPLEEAVRRRAREELGLGLEDLRLILPTFSYRAVQDGVVEHEMCPVYVARPAPGASLELDESEVAEADWVCWPAFRDRALAGEVCAVSPWCREQVALMAEWSDDPAGWPSGDPRLLPEAGQQP